MEIMIRNISPDDSAAVVALSLQLGYKMTVEDTQVAIQSIMKSTNDVAYAAIAGNKLAGWIHVFYTLRIESKPYCEIGGLVVDAAYRGNGIGKMLINFAKPWCRERQCSTIRVRCNAIRSEAHGFYLSAAFSEVKEQKVFSINI